MHFVHIEATVEIDGAHSAKVIIKGLNGAETRVRVGRTSVKHHERSPLKAGDIVFKTVAKRKIEGVIEHRVGDQVWVRFNDTHLIEPVEGLLRA